MNNIEIGVTYTSKYSVTPELTAISAGSGDMEVFATPSMVALMENSAMKLVANYLSPEESSVGIAISTTHTRATRVGVEVEATAKVVAVDGRKISFDVVASDEFGVIGEATHDRFVVEREKFLSRLK